MKRKIELYTLTSFERQKLRLAEEMFQDQLNPLHVTLISQNIETKLTVTDIRNYHMHHTPAFFAVLQH